MNHTLTSPSRAPCQANPTASLPKTRRHRLRQPQATPHPFSRPLLALLLAISALARLPAAAEALQFFLDARTTRCFREDIPLGADATLTYTIAQGAGDMPVTVRVKDVRGRAIHERAAADHGAVRFRVPDQVPNARERADTWALRDDDRDEDDAGVLRAIPGGVGDNRLPYAVCFEHARGALRLPRAGGPRRRVIFAIAYGVRGRDQAFYDQLAKEKHLSSTEELFRVVEDRVSEIVTGIDEMRQRELRMTHLSQKTSNMVVTYASFACVLIVTAAIYASMQTMQELNKKKGR